MYIYIYIRYSRNFFKNYFIKTYHHLEDTKCIIVDSYLCYLGWVEPNSWDFITKKLPLIPLCGSHHETFTTKEPPPPITTTTTHNRQSFFKVPRLHGSSSSQTHIALRRKGGSVNKKTKNRTSRTEGVEQSWWYFWRLSKSWCVCLGDFDSKVYFR